MKTCTNVGGCGLSVKHGTDVELSLLDMLTTSEDKLKNLSSEVVNNARSSFFLHSARLYTCTKNNSEYWTSF